MYLYIDLLYIYLLIITIGFGLIIYQIYKYGFKGYIDRRVERRKRRFDMFYDTIQKIHI
jgi:hypothetical protein